MLHQLSRLILLICIPFHLNASDSLYLPDDTTALFASLDRIEKSSIASYGNDILPKYVEYYERRTDGLIGNILAEDFIFDDKLISYLIGIYSEIARANHIDTEPFILVSRSPIPNAASLGDGIFIINLGLFNSLESEEELAFVIAHELAHDQLRHINQRLESLPDPPESAKKERRRIRRLIRREGLNSLKESMRNEVYRGRRHSRANEFEADSIGHIYIQNTRFAEGGSSALMSLHTFEMFDLKESELLEILSTKSFTIDKTWIKPKKKMFGGSFGSSEESQDSFWQKDSLATHPDAEIRAEKLSVDASGSETSQFNPIRIDRDLIEKEISADFVRRKLPIHAIIWSLDRMKMAPNDPAFYWSVIVSQLAVIQNSISEHDFDDLVPPSSYFDSSGGKAICRLVRNMSKSELGNLIATLSNEKLE
ncbi:MAG: M48 family metallopeptidase [Bacteroidota bacterium]